jgi:hypothetical protein
MDSVNVVDKTMAGILRMAKQIIANHLEVALDPKPDPLIDEITASVHSLVLDGKRMAEGWLTSSENKIVRPTARFYSRSGIVSEVIIDTMDDDDVLSMTAFATAFATVLAAVRIDGYFVISEAWIAGYGTDPEVDKLKPSKRDTRQEVVVVSAANATGHDLAMYPIERDEQGNVTLADSISGDMPVQFSNPIFSNLYWLLPKSSVH